MGRLLIILLAVLLCLACGLIHLYGCSAPNLHGPCRQYRPFLAAPLFPRRNCAHPRRKCYFLPSDL